MSTIKNVYPEWDGKSKLLNIELVDPKWTPGDCVRGFDYPVLFQDEVNNIRKSVEDTGFYGDSTIDAVNFAISVLIKYFCDNKIDHMVADIGAKEKSLEPAKEMTMEDIEKELGYKIKIVKRKED